MVQTHPSGLPGGLHAHRGSPLGLLPGLHRGRLPGSSQDDPQAGRRHRCTVTLYGTSGAGGEAHRLSRLPGSRSDQPHRRHQHRAAFRQPEPLRLPRRPAPEDRPAAQSGLLLREPHRRGVQQARHQRGRQHLPGSGQDPVQPAVHLRRSGPRQDAPHPGHRHRHQGEIPGPRPSTWTPSRATAWWISWPST